jgi:pyridoxamine 5'-phosphate oxidase
MDTDPFNKFSTWFEQAKSNEPSDFDAVSVASVDHTGRPAIRTVLMRAYDRRGFVFYTNLNSRKAENFKQNPAAAMCFHWKSTARQVRIEGTVAIVDDENADAYFSARQRESQVGAWASKQSEILEDRAVLESRYSEIDERYANEEIPRPPFWSGYRLEPDHFEFWDKRPFRLHDRTAYTLAKDRWVVTKLHP